MRKFSSLFLFNFNPNYTIAIIYLLLNLFVNLNPYFGLNSSDFGLMMIQVEDIIQSNFTSLAIQYSSFNTDPSFEFYPFTKPFLGKVNSAYYIDFPPYYPLMIAFIKIILGKYAYYFFSNLSSLGNLILIKLILSKFSIKQSLIHLSLILYSLCTTIFTYNFFIHEYPLAVFLITFSIYFAINFNFDKNNKELFLFGFFSGISLFFRLEMIFITAATGLALVYSNRKKILPIFVYSLFGFLIPFTILIILNQEIHGHPLGLRFVVTINDNPSLNLIDRINIAKELLFGNFRGLFIQSLFFALIPILGSYSKRDSSKDFFLILIAIAFIAILFSSPNHGDHIAPRYFFGLYPIGVITFIIFLNEFFQVYESKIYKGILFLIIIYSIQNCFKNYVWMHDVFSKLNYFQTTIRDLKTDSVIFTSYAEPLNSQNIYLEKKVQVANTPEKMRRLLEIKKNKGKLNLAIVGFGLYNEAFDLKRLYPKLILNQEKLFYTITIRE
jgi:hypothetical protein